jgi:lysine N6-hydroxylase
MKHFDYIGIGAGPSGLSLAALSSPVAGLDGILLEARPGVQWHPGLMLPGVSMQTSYLKDLVTLVDPTSPYSFLNFLVVKGRIYRSNIANEFSCSRQEYEQYLEWVAAQLPGIRWSHRVKSVSITGRRFEVGCEDGERLFTSNLVLSSGREPYLPEFAATLQDPRVMHSSHVLYSGGEWGGKDVMVVGGGQSAAEIVRYLLCDAARRPASLIWVSGSDGFLPIDDSPFTNEWFAPPYVEYFSTLPDARRAELLHTQRLASDGITESVLRDIYTALYQLDITSGGAFRHVLLPAHRVTALERDGERLLATLRGIDRGNEARLSADCAVFCTGYRTTFPDYLEPLREYIPDTRGLPRVRQDFSVEWAEPDGLRLYAMNLADNSHGVADRNLSVISWRSARIINAMAGRDVYRLDHAESTMTWACSADDDGRVTAAR